MTCRTFCVSVCFVLLATLCTWAQDDKANQANIDIRDYCDPDSFNAAIGPDSCVRDTSTGAINFTGFIAELGADKSVGAWRFAPGQIRVAEGATLELHNLGGETHTFTEVKRFGGGFVDVLNALSGNTTPAPECAQMVDGALVPQPPSDENMFIPAGASTTVQLNQEVVKRYQCCIHPWMRLTITPKDEHHVEIQ